MMKNTESVKVNLLNYYNNLGNGEKGRFSEFVCNELDCAYSTFHNKLKDDNFSPAERHFFNTVVLPKFNIEGEI